MRQTMKLCFHAAGDGFTTSPDAARARRRYAHPQGPRHAARVPHCRWCQRHGHATRQPARRGAQTGIRWDLGAFLAHLHTCSRAGQSCQWPRHSHCLARPHDFLTNGRCHQGPECRSEHVDQRASHGHSLEPRFTAPHSFYWVHWPREFLVE